MQEWQMEMATQQAENERERLQKEAAAKALPDKLRTPDQYLTTVCESCEDDLPEFRMQRGCTKCVPCLQLEEAKSKLFSRN